MSKTKCTKSALTTPRPRRRRSRVQPKSRRHEMMTALTAPVWAEPWHTRRIPEDLRPSAMPQQWGAHWFADDLAHRTGRPFAEAEPIYAAGIALYEFILTTGAPWCAIDPAAFVGFLIASGGEDQYSPARVVQLVRQLDYAADYLHACGLLGEARRDTLLAEAQRVFEDVVKWIQ